MKFRNWDCPLLNSPDLSLGATQSVIFAACALLLADLPRIGLRGIPFLGSSKSRDERLTRVSLFCIVQIVVELQISCIVCNE